MAANNINTVEVICSRSGLKFEAPNRRIKVHPEISYYTSHKNYGIRYPAIEVIERGKKEGWDTLEKFEEEIYKALHPEPSPQPSYDFEGAWLAQITGSSEKYRFTRIFLNPVDENGRFKRFVFGSSGVFETCYKSSKDNETRHYYLIENGTRKEIEFSVVEQMFPAIETIHETLFNEGCIKVKGNLGAVGQLVKHESNIWFVKRVESQEYWEEDDGITHTSYPGDGAMFSWTESHTWLFPATEEQIKIYESEQDVNKLKQQARARLKEIQISIRASYTSDNSPVKCFPKGKEIVIKQGFFQPNVLLVLEKDKIWSLIYNGRDGDDWSFNNVGGTHIGCWAPLTPELKTEIEEICKILGV